MPSLWLVDGSHTIFRAYHALPHLSTRQGVPTNAVYGFTTMLLRAIREGNPTHLAVAFDEEAKAKRSEVYSAYKATRGAPPEDLTPQFPLVRRVLEALRVPAIGFPGYEADDVIATLARRARAQGWEVVIVSGDKDLMQLVVNGIRCYDSMYEKWYGPEEVEEKWGVPPKQVADLLALTGDKIDNIPGVPGVGEKTAAGLLKEYGSLEAVLANAGAVKKPKLRENLLASIDRVRIGRRLIALYDDLALPVQLGHRPRQALFGPAELDARKAIAVLKSLFEDASIVKDGHDLKRDLDAWRRAGVRLAGIGIDARLASYLLDPTGRDHSLQDTARELISCELPILKDICEKSGKGKKATPLPEVPVDEVSAAACALVEGARLLAGALGEDLRADAELNQLYTGLELPLLRVLSDLELAGINLDTARLKQLG